MDKPSLRITRVIKASSERVFGAWTSSEALRAWHCPEGFTVSGADCDARIGGRYAVSMVAPDGSNHRAAGQYLEVTPFTKLSFTWSWEVGGDPADGSQVTVSLRALGQDITELTLFHERLEDEDSMRNHMGGWTGALNNLERYVTE